ncbi:MAG: DUF2400 domain-containing protein [Bacteroidia bacterium]|nr:DUF2400 domain-containing protein [Bacteroidia bacterium]MDW8236361.1 DUF2400 family protein [Bacteroidia bacterium]
MGALSLSELRAKLEALYHTYHQPAYRVYDPVEKVWGYTHPRDQELVGLFAALFAWGRREVAIRKTTLLLEAIGNSPYHALHEGYFPHDFSWQHRTWRLSDVEALWRVLGRLYRKEGSLEAFFWRRRRDWEGAIAEFQEFIYAQAPQLQRHMGSIRRGSPSKRLQLWLRWMVRRDCIDPGPWEGIKPEVLFVPIDTHWLQWLRREGILSRRQPTWNTVQKSTSLFRTLSPADPLRYDFALVTASALGYLVPQRES